MEEQTMDISPQPYERLLGDGLRLRSVVDRADQERLARFNREIHGEGVDSMSLGLMREHPGARPEHWLFVEDTATGAVVSSLCLLPWTLRYEDVELRAAEMGIVGTAEAYRRRGLVRHLTERFSQLMREGGYILSHIQGIGFFYRQFGYDYAMPLNPDWRIEPYLVPAPPTAGTYHFRPATAEDIGLLAPWYREATTTLGISTIRDADIWRYLLGTSTGTALAAETWVVELQGTPVGYLRINQHGSGTGLIVGEVSHLSADAALPTLAWLNTIAHERNKPYIELNLPLDATLLTVARAYGAHEAGTYAWQVRVPDPAAFIRLIAPVLERRVARSIFAGTTRQFKVEVYREIIELTWENGRLIHVAQVTTGARADLWLLPQLVAPLMLGHRPLDELRRAYPDVGASAEGAMFANVLWPRMSSFLYTQY
jgi:hypothetical protein